MKRTAEQGFTLIELLIVVAIISIIAAIAVPGLLRARAQANEAVTVASLKSTAVAQVGYSTGCGKGNFAVSYQVLGTPPGGNPNVEGFIGKELGHAPPVEKAGYVYNLAPGAGAAAGGNDCNGTPTTTSWYASAVPQSVGNSGYRGFAINTHNTVWEDSTGVAPTEPFTPSATVSVAK